MEHHPRGGREASQQEGKEALIGCCGAERLEGAWRGHWECRVEKQLLQGVWSERRAGGLSEIYFLGECGKEEPDREAEPKRLKPTASASCISFGQLRKL